MASPLSLPPKGSATTASSSTTAASTPLQTIPESPLPGAVDAFSAPLPPQSALPPLHVAAQRGDLPYLRSLVSNGPPTSSTPSSSTFRDPREVVNERDEQGITPLHWAAINGHLLFCKELLLAGAETDVRGGELEGTALHWAARNGHLPIVHLLLNPPSPAHPSDPTLRDSQSFTPLHLAVHSSSAFLLAYLLFATLPPASPDEPNPVDLPDAEGHTSLSWAAYQGDAISVELLLSSPLAAADPNREDAAGLRPLHWAVTKGNSECIRRLVEAGAELNARSAVVEGAHGAGSGGKTAREMAVELKSLAAYNRGLASAGVDPSTGRPFDTPFKSTHKTRVAIFAVVALGMGLVFATASSLPWYSSLLLGAAECYGTHHVVSRVLLGIKSSSSSAGGHSHGGHGHHHGGGGGGERLTKSPYLCAIITASLGWVAWVWVSRYLGASSASPSHLPPPLLGPPLSTRFPPSRPHLEGKENRLTLSPFSSRAALPPSYAPSSLLFCLSLLTCSYSFWRAITLDPGTVEREGAHEGGDQGRGALKETIEYLVETNQFNGMNFCLTCLVRRPLRSKHSYATGRCVARFDHYCPWVWNDVGVNNHRQFILFLASLVTGVLFFTHLTWGYFYERAPSLPPTYTCPSLLPTPLCVATAFDTLPLLVAVWAFLQLTWTIVLLSVQIWQIVKQMTTLEASNVQRFGYMGGRAGVSGASQLGYAQKFNPPNAGAGAHEANVGGGAGDGAEEDDPSDLAHAPSASPQSGGGGAGGRARPKGKFAFLLKLLGLDRFVSSSSSSFPHNQPRDRPSTVTNPFDLGPLSNCYDFWTRGRELGVRYDRLYAEGIPREGFKVKVRERRRREREEREEERRGGAGGMGAKGGAGERLRGLVMMGRRGGGEGSGQGQGGRAGYERVAMEDVV
ncbi:hypothetical protein JCM11251_001978 [Rhodosporidiobolus azoricus]